MPWKLSFGTSDKFIKLFRYWFNIISNRKYSSPFSLNFRAFGKEFFMLLLRIQFWVFLNVKTKY